MGLFSTKVCVHNPTKGRVQKTMADALGRRDHSLTIMKISILAFDCLKELYTIDEDFKNACMD